MAFNNGNNNKVKVIKLSLQLTPFNNHYKTIG